MRVLRDLDAVRSFADPDLSPLIERRLQDLAGDDGLDPWEVVFFIVVEPGDSASALDGPLGFSVLCSRFDGVRFNEPGFCRSWELLEEHRCSYEIVIVLSDDGAGAEIFIPKVRGIDPDLLALCQRYATRAQESTEP